jgi:transcriptional regulator with XRE-family HTH domain
MKKGRSGFARNLEALMKSAAITQEALGDEVGVCQSTINRLLNGQREPDLELARKIATALRAPIHLLVSGTELATQMSAPCVATLDPEAHIKRLAYFASALTGLSEAQKDGVLADATLARAACEEFQTFLYEPSWYTDPTTNKNLTPDHVYAIDHEQVSQSHFVILHGRHPSFGAGEELEIAAAMGLPVILLAPAGVEVSRMVRGTYARLHEVPFRDSGELTQGLRRVLTIVVAEVATIKDERHRIRDIIMGAESTDGFPDRVKRTRTRMGLDQHLVAKLVGISETALRQIEAGKFTNPSLVIVRRLALVLKTSVSALVDGMTARWEDTDPRMRQSLDALLELAEEEKLTPAQVQSHWQLYVTEVTPARLSVADARLEPLTRAGWRDRLVAPRKTCVSGKLFSDE